MNKKRYDMIIDLINEILTFLPCYILISMGLLSLTKDAGLVYRSLLLIPAPLLSYGISKKTHSLWSFLLLHLTLVVIYVFWGREHFVFIFYCLYLIFLTIRALKLKLQEETIQKTNTSLFLLALFLAMYFLVNYLKFTELNVLVLVLSILYVLLYLLNMYLINFERFFIHHASLVNIPMGQIKTTNHSLILFFGGILTLTMLLFTKVPIKTALLWIGSLLKRGLQLLFSLFHGSDKGEVPMETPADIGDSAFPFKLDPADPSPILEFIQNLVLGFITIAIITGMLALLAYGLYKLYQRFYGRKINYFKDKAEFINPFELKETSRKNKNTAVRRFSFGFSGTNQDKIRKFYYRAVLSKHEKKEIPAHMLPIRLSELALYLDNDIMDKPVNQDKIRELTAYYEKARYGREECSKEEVTAVKELLKNNRRK